MKRKRNLIFLVFILFEFLILPTFPLRNAGQSQNVVLPSFFAPPGGGSGTFSVDTQTLAWMEVNQLHSLGYTGDGAKVAVIDSGLYAHDYFTSTLSTNLQYYLVNGQSQGYSISSTTSWTSSLVRDQYGHGTKVVGALLQFAPDTDLVFYSLDSTSSSVDWFRVEAALEHLSIHHGSMGVDILSMSFGNRNVPSANPTLAALIEDHLFELASEGVTVFIASGNSYDLPVAWPAEIASDVEGIFSVGAVFDQYYEDFAGGPTNPFALPPYDRHIGEIYRVFPMDEQYAGTSHGSNLEVMASGFDIKTTTNDGGGTSNFAETSSATPIAAGSVACLIERWQQMNGFTTIPNDFIEGTVRGMAEYRYGSDPLLYGSGVASPYDCRIYPLSVAGYSIHTGYMFTQYDAEFYNHGFSVYLEWMEKKRYWGWVTHNDLVLFASVPGWITFHAQNMIRPEFLQGNMATIQWRYKMVVYGPSMTITTGWTTSIVYPDLDDPPL